jgi:ketosteroid isomerase-like protein
MSGLERRVQSAEVWLRAFAKAVRERDYAGARAMCHEDVTGFGTVTPRFDGIDELQQEQWQQVWDQTEGFDFDVDSASIWADDSLVVAISEWSSTGVNRDGSRRARRGRATVVLAGADDALRAVHTHFSMSPGYSA